MTTWNTVRTTELWQLVYTVFNPIANQRIALNSTLWLKIQLKSHSNAENANYFRQFWPKLDSILLLSLSFSNIWSVMASLGLEYPNAVATSCLKENTKKKERCAATPGVRRYRAVPINPIAPTETRDKSQGYDHLNILPLNSAATLYK